jgi:hypothetical protein
LTDLIPTCSAHRRHSKDEAEAAPEPEPAAELEPPPPAKKSRSGRSTSRAPVKKHKGRRKGGMNVPLELLYQYHLDERGDLLGKGAKQAVADRFETRTDSLNAKVQSALLHKQVKARLRPGCEDLLSEKGCAKSRAPTLELNKKRLKLEGLLTWQKFEAAYLKPRN